MIVDERTYRIHPGKLDEFIAIFEQHGLPVQRRILGNLIGYFTTDVGELNCIVQLWGYESMEDRSRRRKQLFGDPEWAAYRTMNTHMIQDMSNRILVSTSFSPI
jgi:hypothetical protein